MARCSAAGRIEFDAGFGRGAGGFEDRMVRQVAVVDGVIRWISNPPHVAESQILVHELVVRSLGCFVPLQSALDTQQSLFGNVPRFAESNT